MTRIEASGCAPGLHYVKLLKIPSKLPKTGPGSAVETAATVEIDKGRLRQYLLDDFHKLLGSLLASTLTTSPTTIN
jgi:hypothetical protein